MNKKAFTLIELLAVIVILAIIAVIAHDNGVIDCEYTVTTQYAGIRPVITLPISNLG